MVNARKHTVTQDTPDVGGTIQSRHRACHVPWWQWQCVGHCDIPCSLSSSHHVGSSATFMGPQDLLGWNLWGPPCCFDYTCALTLIHNQIYSKLGCKCKSESKWWKPHGKTKGTSALKLSTGDSLCWQGVVSLHNDAFIQTVFCILGDRCALQLLVEVKC